MTFKVQYFAAEQATYCHAMIVTERWTEYSVRVDELIYLQKRKTLEIPQVSVHLLNVSLVTQRLGIFTSNIHNSSCSLTV